MIIALWLSIVISIMLANRVLYLNGYIQAQRAITKTALQNVEHLKTVIDKYADIVDKQKEQNEALTERLLGASIDGQAIVDKILKERDGNL